MQNITQENIKTKKAIIIPIGIIAFILFITIGIISIIIYNKKIEYPIENYVGLNCGSFGDVLPKNSYTNSTYQSTNIVDKYDNRKIELIYKSEDGKEVNNENRGVYIVVSQNIKPGTDSKKVKRIVLTVKKIEQ